MSLPKWLQDSKKPRIVYKRESGKMLNKEPVKVEGRAADTALFVGPARGRILMQEVLDREGVGRMRRFDANAKSGKGGSRLSDVERKVSQIAHSIEK